MFAQVLCNQKPERMHMLEEWLSTMSQCIRGRARLPAHIGFARECKPARELGSTIFPQAKSIRTTSKHSHMATSGLGKSSVTLLCDIVRESRKRERKCMARSDPSSSLSAPRVLIRTPCKATVVRMLVERICSVPCGFACATWTCAQRLPSC